MNKRSLKTLAGATEAAVRASIRKQTQSKTIFMEIIISKVP